MPLTWRLIEMIHDIEESRRPMGWSNIEELEALAKLGV
jgi:hypothetical protein